MRPFRILFDLHLLNCGEDPQGSKETGVDLLL